VVVLDIYAAREDPEPGVTGALIADAFIDQTRMHYVPEWDDVPDAVAAIAQPGDFVITMGCGDVYRQVPGILKALEN
jgi:UDP-N-acetylmuramate--alanine ligase